MRFKEIISDKEADIPEIRFCEKHCGELTNDQKVMVIHNIKKGLFLGVARPLGQSYYCPMVITYNQKSVNVIDKAGYYQNVAPTGRKMYVEDK